ncbi:MAG: hypothetical protein NTW59_03485 [Candidatus Diapherotrites archaeon]|nr:hypothetical protein [Candidatus Diapherotrites archaeon]
MYDKFDQPISSDRQLRIEEEGIGAKLSGIKPHLKKIIALVVIAVVAWFAEGTPLAASLKVFAEGSDTPVFSDSGDDTYTFSLRNGKYRFEAKASEAGYAQFNQSLTVSPASKPDEIKLPKTINVGIVDFDSVFPQQLFVGESRQLLVQLKNNGSSAVPVELVAEGDLDGIASSGTVTLFPNSTGQVALNVNVPESTVVKDKTKGDAKTATVRVKFTNEEQDAKFTLLPNPSTGIEVNSPSFSAKALEGKNKDTVDITITNKNGFPLTDVNVSVEITAASKNNAADVLEWFKFSEIADQPKPWAISIDAIPAKGKAVKELMVELPLTAKKESDIKGNIVVSAPYLSIPVKKTLTLGITEEATYGLQLTLAQKPPYDISWNSTSGKYEEKNGTLSVKNTGQAELHNIVVSIGNESDCSTDWLTLVESTIDSLGAGKTAPLRFNFTAPIAMRGNESVMKCDVAYRFDNPAQLGVYVQDTENEFIQINPKK